MARIYKEVIQEGEKVKRLVEEFVVFEYDKKGNIKSYITDDENRLDDYDDAGNINNIPEEILENNTFITEEDLWIENCPVEKVKVSINEKNVKTTSQFCLEDWENEIEIKDDFNNIIFNYLYITKWNDIEEVRFDDNRNLISFKDHDNICLLDYDNNKLIHTKQSKYNTEVFFEYDSEGLLCRKIELSRDGEDKYFYEYDGYKRIIHVLVESSYSNEDSELWYEYDKYGNLCDIKNSENYFCKFVYDLKQKLVSFRTSNGNVVKYSPNGKVVFRKTKEGVYSYTYNDSGVLIHKTRSKDDLIIEEEKRNDNGKVIYEKYYDTEKFFTYNNYGLLIQRKELEEDSKVVRKWNEDKKLIYKEEYGCIFKYSYTNGILNKVKCSDESEYKYDDNGNIISYSDEEGNTYLYEYDENNNIIHYKNSVVEEWYEYELWENGKIKRKTCYRAL